MIRMIWWLCAALTMVNASQAWSAADVGGLERPSSNLFYAKYLAYAKAYQTKDAGRIFSMWMPGYYEIYRDEKNVPATLYRKKVEAKLLETFKDMVSPRVTIKMDYTNYWPDDMVTVLIYLSYYDETKGLKSSVSFKEQHIWQRVGNDWNLQSKVFLKDLTFDDFISESRKGTLISSPSAMAKDELLPLLRPTVASSGAITLSPKPSDTVPAAPAGVSPKILEIARKHFIIGEKAAFRGDKAVAIREWQTVLKLVPNSRYTKEALSRLKSR